MHIVSNLFQKLTDKFSKKLHYPPEFLALKKPLDAAQNRKTISLRYDLIKVILIDNDRYYTDVKK